jgi:hypothetical protein
MLMSDLALQQTCPGAVFTTLHFLRKLGMGQ